MITLDIPIHASVQCTDGNDGHVDRIIVDPSTDKITHIVVREAGVLGENVLVPVEVVTESTANVVHLHLLRKELEAMPTFVETSFTTSAWDTVPLSYLGYGMYPMGGVRYWPYYPLNESDFVHIDSNIPKGELAMRRHDAVEAIDGKVGQIDEFMVDPRTDAITHLVLREGHLWGQKHITIPVSGIASIADGVVKLKLKKAQIAALPSLRTGQYKQTA